MFNNIIYPNAVSSDGNVTKKCQEIICDQKNVFCFFLLHFDNRSSGILHSFKDVCFFLVNAHILL